jgi:phospholipid/cholesterol/gamma-HCH transport system permease protein
MLAVTWHLPDSDGVPESVSKPATARWLDATDGKGFCLEVSGCWQAGNVRPTIEGADPGIAPARIQVADLGAFDSTLPAFLLAFLRRDGGQPDQALDALPANLRGLMQLALAVPDQEEVGEKPRPTKQLGKLGNVTLGVWAAFLSLSDFLGQTLLSFGRLVTGRAHFRTRDFLLTLQQCGADALPIVSLISFLIGMIMAFVGNVQLANFGASLYIADLVAIAMVRELGVVMTAIILSGRTGAAFAAQLGSMNANEEIDALRSFGFNPFDFLVLPRVLALLLMMPVLTVYANIVGILGGMMVGAAVGIPPALYWHETLDSITLLTASLGVMKSFFFGAVIALSGCMQGMNAGGSSAAVGRATTRAVVISITAIIVLDSAFAAIFTVLDI